MSLFAPQFGFASSSSGSSSAPQFGFNSGSGRSTEPSGASSFTLGGGGGGGSDISFGFGSSSSSTKKSGSSGFGFGGFGSEGTTNNAESDSSSSSNSSGGFGFAVGSSSSTSGKAKPKANGTSSQSTAFASQSAASVIGGPSPWQQAPGWMCDVCRSRNPLSAEKCGACEAPRPRSTFTAPTTSSTTAEQKSVPALQPVAADFSGPSPWQQAPGWMCDVCGSRNPLAQEGACAACEAPKPAGAASAASGVPQAAAPASSTDDDMKDFSDDDDDAVRGEDLDDDDDQYCRDHDFNPVVLAQESIAMAEGAVRCLGAGTGLGPCGMGDDQPNHVLPEVLPHTRDPKNARWVRIRSWGVISAAVDEDGQLWTWGECENGALGRVIVPESGGDYWPGKVDFPGTDAGRRVADFSMGNTHMAAVLDNGHCYTWGSFDIRGVWKGHHVENNYPHGEHFVEKQFTPWRVHMSRHPIVAVASGNDHYVALDSRGYVFMQGMSDGVAERRRPGADGNARPAALKNQLKPRRVFGKSRSIKFSSIAAGGDTVWAVDAAGTKLYAMGCNVHSQCGPNGARRVARTCFVEVPLPREPQSVAARRRIVRVAGSRHVLALLEDGSVYSWGRNADKTLGYETAKAPSTFNAAGREIKGEAMSNANPRRIPVGKVIDFATGEDHTLLHLATGKVIGFGFCSEFRMGNGKQEVDEDDMPQTIFEANHLSKNDFILKDLAAGSGHSLFLIKKVKDVAQALAAFTPTTPGPVDASSVGPAQIAARKERDRKREEKKKERKRKRAASKESSGSAPAPKKKAKSTAATKQKKSAASRKKPATKKSKQPKSVKRSKSVKKSKAKK